MCLTTFPVTDVKESTSYYRGSDSFTSTASVTEDQNIFSRVQARNKFFLASRASVRKRNAKKNCYPMFFPAGVCSISYLRFPRYRGNLR